MAEYRTGSRTASPTRSRSALERFSQELDRSYASAQPVRRDNSARSLGADRSISAVSGISATEAVPPPSSPVYRPKTYSSATPAVSSYDLSPSRAGRAVTDDIGSLSASLKSLATLVQTLDNKLADEKAQRLRLEEKVQQLARGGDDTSGKLSKLEKSLQHQLDDVVGQVTATGVENREAWGALSTTVESYNDEVEDRVNQLAKTLVSASRDAKDRSEGLEREFQSALAASALAMEEQASRVEARFVTERKGTSEKWDAVERNLTSRMEPLEARLAESRASLTRMLEESNRGHNASRERQQKLMNEQSAKLRQQIGDANSVTTERLDKSMSDMEEKVGKSVEEVVQLLGRLKNGLEEKQSSMERRHEEAMDDQIKIRQAAEARLKEEIAGARSELRDLVSTTKAEMAAADEALGAECAANLKTTADDLAYDLDTLKEELVATEDTLAAKIMEEEVARKALDTSFTEKLGSSVRLLGDLVDKTEAELTAAIDQLRQKVEVDVKEQIAQLDTDVNARLSALKELVDGKVSKSIEEMTGKMDTMNARIKQEMAPRLDETEKIAKRADGSVETLKTRLVLEQEELKTGVTKSLETLGKELDEMTEKVDGMTADLDINALLIGAAAAVP